MGYKYCKCGQPININWRWNGVKYVLEVFCGSHIETHCPVCGQWWINEDDFITEWVGGCPAPNLAEEVR
jgi:hypothetical protein